MKKVHVVMLSALVLLGSLVSQAQESATGEISPPVSGSGTTDYLPLWTNGTTLGSSVLFQSGTGAKAKVGIGTTDTKIHSGREGRRHDPRVVSACRPLAQLRRPRALTHNPWI